MFDNSIILGRIFSVKNLYTVSKSINITYNNIKYEINIGQLANDNYFTWLIFMYKENNNKQLVAYSTKKYNYDLDKIEKAAFKCIQKISKYIEDEK